MPTTLKDEVVGFVVLSWNGATLLSSCLNSLINQTFKDFVVCVVDNGSTDNTRQVFESAKLDSKVLISNHNNRGFAPAVNQAVNKLLNDYPKMQYIVLLNNDVVLDKSWLKSMVKYMDTDADVALAQGYNYSSSDRQSFDSTGIYLEEGFIPRQKTNLESEPKAVGPNAAAIILRRQFVEEISYKGELLDASFFAYVEDVDLLIRAYLRGYKYGINPAATAVHSGSATGNRVSTKKMYWGARNMIWLLVKDVPLGVIFRKFKKIVISHLADIEYLYKTDRRLMKAYCLGTLVGILKAPLYLPKRWYIMHGRLKTNQEIIGVLTPSNPPLTNPVKYILRKLHG